MSLHVDFGMTNDCVESTSWVEAKCLLRESENLAKSPKFSRHSSNLRLFGGSWILNGESPSFSVRRYLATAVLVRIIISSTISWASKSCFRSGCSKWKNDASERRILRLFWANKLKSRILVSISDVNSPSPELQWTDFPRIMLCACVYVKRHCEVTIVRQKSNVPSSWIRPSWSKVINIEIASRSCFGSRLQIEWLSSFGSMRTSPSRCPFKWLSPLFWASWSILLPSWTK